MRSLKAALLGLVIVGASATTASAGVAVAGPGATYAGYATRVVVVEPGETLTFYSADLPEHDFVARDAFVPKKAARKTKWCSGFPTGKCPLFWSARINAGASTQVLGLNRVAPGKQYTFYCTVHPNMTGILVVR